MSTWSTPKEDWDTDDGIDYGDLNRIESNINYLRPSKGSDITGAADLDISVQSLYEITGGATTINRILSNTKQAGEIVHFTSAFLNYTFHHGTSASGNYAGLLTRTGSDITLGSTGVVQAIFDGTFWRVTLF